MRDLTSIAAFQDLNNCPVCGEHFFASSIIRDGMMSLIGNTDLIYFVYCPSCGKNLAEVHFDFKRVTLSDYWMDEVGLLNLKACVALMVADDEYFCYLYDHPDIYDDLTQEERDELDLDAYVCFPAPLAPWTVYTNGHGAYAYTSMDAAGYEGWKPVYTYAEFIKMVSAFPIDYFKTPEDMARFLEELIAGA